METFFYLFQDIAFLPLQVLLVTIIINELLKKREKKTLLSKMNMVVGAYYSEVGNELLQIFSKFDKRIRKINEQFLTDSRWARKFVAEFRQVIRNCDYSIDLDQGNLLELRDFLRSQRAFIVTLLQNGNLLEHESFTDMLWAVTHLAEELSFRQSCHQLSEDDKKHLTGDVRRAYMYSLNEWISYMVHLKDDYPYIFSLYLRTNPFDKQAKVEF